MSCFEIGHAIQMGYPTILREGIRVACHRVNWEFLYGPIPSGYVLHHVCYNKLCIRPDHLCLMSRGGHLLEHNVNEFSIGLSRPKRRRSHCLRGHERVPSNVTKNGTCKQCKLRHERLRNLKIRKEKETKCLTQ